METRNGYVEIDLQLEREAQPWLEFSLNGQNLLDNDQRKLLPDLTSTQPTDAERGIHGRPGWRL